MQDESKTKDLLTAFRECRGQVSEHYSQSLDRTVQRGYQRVKTDKNSSRYQSFLDKYENLAETIDEFKTQDLMYFFREKARESDVHYVIANMKRDMGIFKRLRENYTSREICLMIEFVFCSGQKYLDIKNTQPTLLASNWCNTIYNDSIAWANDEFDPNAYSSKKTSAKKNREWGKAPKEEKTVIGAWK
jgi:hypothetical protein